MCPSSIARCPPLPSSSSNPFPPSSYPDYHTHLSDLESNATHRYSANSHVAYSDASHRNLLPWSAEMEDRPSLDLDPGTKEERMRMLEKEFLGKGKGKEVMDQEGRRGSVNDDGELITDGPKRRAFIRWMQCIFALTAAGSGIYGAMVRHIPCQYWLY